MPACPNTVLPSPRPAPPANRLRGAATCPASKTRAGAERSRWATTWLVSKTARLLRAHCPHHPSSGGRAPIRPMTLPAIARTVLFILRVASSSRFRSATMILFAVNGDLGGQNACFHVRARAGGVCECAEGQQSLANSTLGVCTTLGGRWTYGCRDHPAQKKTCFILI